MSETLHLDGLSSNTKKFSLPKDGYNIEIHEKEDGTVVIIKAYYVEGTDGDAMPEVDLLAVI